MVLKCEIGISGREASVEEYVLDALAASAESVVPGLGPLAGMLAGLAGELAGGAAAMTLEAMEELVVVRGRELLRAVFQFGLDAGADAEVRLPEVTGADGVRRAPAGRDHARTIVTTVGGVRVQRIGYRAKGKGKGKGVPALFPRDAVLNLPLCRYSWPLQQLAARSARDGAYGLAQEFVQAATGITIGKRQLEEIAAAAAADVAAFYAGPAPGGPGQPPGRPPGRAEEGKTLPLVLSADGKGVAMRPESRRTRTTAPDQRVKNFSTRPGIGEKGHKRIAEVTCVFDVIPQPRTPEQVMACHHGSGTGAGKKEDKPAPKAVNRRYQVDIAADRSAAISWAFDEGESRDPGHDRDWIALAGGDNHQINLMQAEAAARGITGLTILIDLIHVMEYLWKAAWAFHQPRDPAIETWTITQATDILHGRAAEVIDRIARIAAGHPPQGPEHARNIRRVLSYLRARQPCLDYPKALAAGWPVATGVIEGACRHLVKDRMGITGARWSTDGAQAILWLRVIRANHDHDDYWNHHIQQEHQRNHLSRYADHLTLAA
jgi:hypothetical protein